MRLSDPIVSPRLILTTLETDAADGPYLRWLRDPDVVRFLEVRHLTHSEESLRTYIAAAIASPVTLLLGIHLRSDHRHVGNLKLGPIDRSNRRAELGLLIGEADCRGGGVGREAIAAATRYAFEHLDLDKVTAGYLEPNLASARAFAAAGYFEEERLPKQFLVEGRWVANVRLGCDRKSLIEAS
jgi:ribosomal-protein-alanine N-acetyltransferase